MARERAALAPQSDSSRNNGPSVPLVIAIIWARTIDKIALLPSSHYFLRSFLSEIDARSNTSSIMQTRVGKKRMDGREDRRFSRFSGNIGGTSPPSKMYYTTTSNRDSAEPSFLPSDRVSD